jgi:hypothetical protein
VEEIEDFFCDALGLSYPTKSNQYRFLRYGNPSALTSLKNAVGFLRQQRLEKEPSDGCASSERDPSLSTLSTIIFICVAFLQGKNEAYQDHMTIERIDLQSLDSLLMDSHSIWVDSERMLSELVWNQFAHTEQNLQLKNQIGTITGSLIGISPLALRGLELCLLDQLIM